MKIFKTWVAAWMFLGLTAVLLPAASLVGGEWFIDGDPGEGAGISITEVSGGLSTREVVIPPAVIDALSDGSHSLGVRFQDDAGSWGQVTWRVFRVLHPSGDLVLGEYFFNDDPGAGLGIPLGGMGDSTFDATPTVSLSELPAGANLLGVRFRNTAGRWGQVTHRVFLNPESGTRTLNRVAFVVYRAEAPISSGSLLGDGSLAINLTHAGDTVTPVAGESLLLELQAVDESGCHGQKVFREVAVEEFSQSFLELFFSTAEQADPQISGDTADADGDGIENLIEQAAGLHPREGNAQGEAMGLDHGRTFRFRAASESAFDAASSTFSLGGLRFEIEVSSDANHWNRATTPADFTVAAESAPNPDASFTHVVDLAGGAQGKRFYRLRVARP